MTDEAIISAFSDGVRNVKMKEELAIHEELCTSREKASISADFRCISSAGTGATNKALQLIVSSSVGGTRATTNFV